MRRRRDTNRNAVDMVAIHRDTTAGHANAQCSTGARRPKLAMCACTAPSRVLEGATAGQHRPDPGPARRLAAASQAFRTHVIIHDRDPALDGAWAAPQARYRARIAKVNIVRQPRYRYVQLPRDRQSETLVMDSPSASGNYTLQYIKYQLVAAANWH